jgi:hypothetical protein
MTHDPESFSRAVREVADAVQVLIYRREPSPIRDRTEVTHDLGKRLEALSQASLNGKRQWRRALVELAAFAVFSAVSDE